MPARTERLRRGAAVAAALLLACAGASASTPVQPRPPDEASYVNQPFPDIVVRTTAGERRLSRLWREGPVILTLVFTRCAGVCSPYLRALHAADERLGAPADVRRVVLSFDPRDTVEDMRRTAAHLEVADRADWIFGVASPADIERVAHAAGFWFTWDADREQFDHPAMLVAVRDGHIARLFVGGTITPARLAEVLREARGQFVASYPLPGNARFRCFDYDPATGRATLAWGSLLMLIPAVTAVAGTLMIFGARYQRRT
jgi:cytochrome oxidase Cu insertion factor (SCO1/SenC/PrrC family)